MSTSLTSKSLDARLLLDNGEGSNSPLLLTKLPDEAPDVPELKETYVARR